MRKFGEKSSKTGLFVDKSLFIQEIIDSQTDPLLITSPRRWGKTINMRFYLQVNIIPLVFVH
ncbi:MAG: AAA family ATPase [Gammaproteobacteria bacterium]